MSHETPLRPNTSSDLARAEADTALTDWDRVEWTPENAANFFQAEECDDECQHPHSHFENMRAMVWDAITTLKDDGEDEDQREESLEFLTETLTPIFAGTAAHVRNLEARIAESERDRLAIARAAVDGLLVGKVFEQPRTTDPLPEDHTPLTRAELERLRSEYQPVILVRRLLATVEQRDRIYAAIQTDADPAGTLREVVELRDLVGQLSERLRLGHTGHFCEGCDEHGALCGQPYFCCGACPAIPKEPVGA